MSDKAGNGNQSEPGADIRDIVRHAVEEFIRGEHRKAEPAYKTELQEERKRLEGLEARLNQLVEENRKARAAAEEADRSSQIRAELQRLGVAKLDLAFRAVKDDVVRGTDGKLRSRDHEAKPLHEFLANFVQENPDLLPARIAGGSGAQNSSRSTAANSSTFDLDKIKPGMSKEDLERARQEIARLASQALRGA